MDLRGWVRTSLLDFPGRIATVLFVGGCNLRCPICHNADLVLRPAALPAVPEEAVWDFLARRAGLVDGLVVTGGEPTLQPDLAPFLRRARERGVALKLDTNGSRPDVLAALLDGGLVDYVALDVKAAPDELAAATGCGDLDVRPMRQSVELLLAAGVACEFRTTVAPGLIDDEGVERIARWIAGAPRYVLQQFRAGGNLDPALERVAPYPAERLHAMADRARPWVQEVVIRGIAER